VGGGAPKPNEPRGTGTPPFFSNFAILSRREFGLRAEEEEEEEEEGFCF
jgi:hypothetical protein